MAKQKKKIIFLDRDGTINIDHGYVWEIEKIQLISGAAEAIRFLYPHYTLVVVSNQSGISRNLFSHNDTAKANAQIEKLLAESGAKIDKICYCPHQTKDKCQCRKPNPGMLQKAAAELGLSTVGSWMVGDRSSDIEAGKAVEARTILLPLPSDVSQPEISPDFRAANLLVASQIILREDCLT